MGYKFCAPGNTLRIYFIIAAYKMPVGIVYAFDYIAQSAAQSLREQN